MRLALPAIGVLLGGCVCNDNICMSTGATPETTVFSTAGQPVTVRAVLPISCGVRMVTSVETSVVDAKSSSLPHDAGSPVTLPGEGFAVDVTFTPVSPGRHHVVARFQPNFGLGQVDVIAAADHRDSGTVLIPALCSRGDFTPGGLALCTTGTNVDVFDGTTKVQTFTGIVARAGGTLWVSDRNRVQRYVEDGGGFELTGSATTETHDSIIPGVDDALFVGLGGNLLWWTDAGVVRTPANAGAGDVAWRNEDRIVTVGTSNWCITSMLDGGQRCPQMMLSGLRIQGLEPAGIWAEHDTATGPEALLFDDTAVRNFALVGGWRLFPKVSVGARIAYDNGVFIVDTDGGTAGPYVLGLKGQSLELEDYGGTPTSITSSCVTRPLNSATRFFHR